MIENLEAVNREEINNDYFRVLGFPLLQGRPFDSRDREGSQPVAPLHLMLADTPWPHGFRATLTNAGPMSEGFERSVASPLQPRRLCAMGRTV